jgi:hypothetical protein
MVGLWSRRYRWIRNSTSTVIAGSSTDCRGSVLVYGVAKVTLILSLTVIVTGDFSLDLSFAFAAAILLVTVSLEWHFFS